MESDNWTTQQRYHLCHATSMVHQPVAAITKIDLGLHGHFHSEVYIGVNYDQHSYNVNMGSDRTDTHVIDLQASVVSFSDKDDRVRTGWVQSRDMTPSGGQTGQCWDKRVDFEKAFEPTGRSEDGIVVRAFIAGFDFGHNSGCASRRLSRQSMTRDSP